ncbi:MAG: cytochrome c oxidase subunit II [Acidobacteria bacterium]|nr:cytochrome c oxidase subunit II [Acidobacteriota bacterium]
MYKNVPIIPLAVIGVIIAAITAGQALFIDWLPPADSVEAGRTFTLLWFLFWCSVVFFVIVTSVLVYAIWKWRAKDDDLEDGPPTHGNTTLEVVWTAVPSILLIVVAVYGYIVLERNEAVAADRVEIDVYAQQFNWTYGYPSAGIESGDLMVPVNRQVQLNVRARDVIHDFWVPQFGIKGDAVPGITHTLWITPTKVGTYPVVCAELCGVGHSVMRSSVHVVTEQQYAAWLAKSSATVKTAAAASAAAAKLETAPGDAAAGKAVFEAKCSGCHAGLGTQAGGVGPKLAGINWSDEQIRTQVKNGKGAMPGGLVNGTDLANVVAYVQSIQ